MPNAIWDSLMTVRYYLCVLLLVCYHYYISTK